MNVWLNANTFTFEKCHFEFPGLKSFVETSSRGKVILSCTKNSKFNGLRIMVAYVNVARYEPLRGGTYLDLPQKLKSKKAIDQDNYAVVDSVN